MSGALLYIGAFILLVGPLILVHELGHLLVAKAVDVKVTRFCLGFGPVLLRLRLGETEYCLAPVPLGGYVRMLGESPDDKPSKSSVDDEPSSSTSVSASKKKPPKELPKPSVDPDPPPSAHSSGKPLGPKGPPGPPTGLTGTPSGPTVPPTTIKDPAPPPSPTTKATE